MSSGIGWVEAEGAEDMAQKTGIPAGTKSTAGVRVVIVAMIAVKAEGAKDDREEETGWKRVRR